MKFLSAECVGTAGGAARCEEWRGAGVRRVDRPGPRGRLIAAVAVRMLELAAAI